MNTAGRLSWSHGRHWFACVSVSLLFSFSGLGWVGQVELYLWVELPPSAAHQHPHLLLIFLSPSISKPAHTSSLCPIVCFSVWYSNPSLWPSLGVWHPSWTLPTTLTCKPAPSVLTSPEPSCLPANLRLTASLETQEFRFCQCPLSQRNFPMEVILCFKISASCNQ